MDLLIVCNKDDVRKRLESCLQAEDLCVTWISDVAHITEHLKSAGAALIILVFTEDEIDGTYQVTLNLKRLHPEIDVLLLPAESDSALEIAVKSAVTMHRKKAPAAGSYASAGLSSHEDEVAKLIHSLKERLGPEASDLIEEVEGVGYRLKPGAARILYTNDPLLPQ